MKTTISETCDQIGVLTNPFKIAHYNSPFVTALLKYREYFSIIYFIEMCRLNYAKYKMAEAIKYNKMLTTNIS